MFFVKIYYIFLPVLKGFFIIFTPLQRRGLESGISGSRKRAQDLVFCSAAPIIPRMQYNVGSETKTLAAVGVIDPGIKKFWLIYGF